MASAAATGLGRFQSTYMRDMTEPGAEDYTGATRHGVRDTEIRRRENVAQNFKFPTGISGYQIDYNHNQQPSLDNYGYNKQPKNEHNVPCARLAGYQTTYGDQSLLLQQKDGLKHYEVKSLEPMSLSTKSLEASIESVPKPFGPWNYTGQLEENIRIQRDRPFRARKGLCHLPGYMGHKPLHNPPSKTAFEPRKPEKEKLLLYDLDQYSRELWPHYKGFKPQAITNVKATPSPTRETTYGHTNYMMQKQQAWSREHRHKSTATLPTQHKKGGTKTFFTQGTTGATSANGEMMAEKFYRFCRPLEGTLVSFRADKMLASKYLE